MFFILTDYRENWISNIWVGYIIPKIIVYVETGHDLKLKKKTLKNVLNVSASSTFFVIVLLLSFNVMHDDIEDFQIWV